MKYSLLIASLLVSAAFNASADEAKSLAVHEEVTINASAAKVWAKVSNFNDLGAWHPAVKTTEIVSGKNNQVGAERLLTLYFYVSAHGRLSVKAATLRCAMCRKVVVFAPYQIPQD